jgi:hypothetical protein
MMLQDERIDVGELDAHYDAVEGLPPDSSEAPEEVLMYDTNYRVGDGFLTGERVVSDVMRGAQGVGVESVNAVIVSHMGEKCIRMRGLETTIGNLGEARRLIDIIFVKLSGEMRVLMLYNYIDEKSYWSRFAWESYMLYSRPAAGPINWNEFNEMDINKVMPVKITRDRIYFAYFDEETLVHHDDINYHGRWHDVLWYVEYIKLSGRYRHISAIESDTAAQKVLPEDYEHNRALINMRMAIGTDVAEGRIQPDDV